MRISTSGVLAVLLTGALLVSTPAFSNAQAPVPPDASAMSAGAGSPDTAKAAAAVANPVASTISLAPGLQGFDNIGADSSAQLSCLSAAGYSFDVIDALGAGWDTEYRSAAAIGMSVVLFQGFYKPFWSDPAQGSARGALMVANAQSVGYPKGAQVFLNLEDNLSDGVTATNRPAMIQWVQNWALAVTAAGYSAGVYVGVPQLLTVADLDSALPAVSVLWRSASGSAPQTSRGYVMRQPSISLAACGTTIDANTSGSDSRGVTLVGAGFPRTVSAPSVPGALGPLTPARIADTRGGGTLPALGSTTVKILGAGGVPAAGVSAVVLNLTAVNPTAGGYLTAWPTGANRPNASNLNFVPGQAVPNLVVVPVGQGGNISVFNGSVGSVDIIADVAGYYRSGTVTDAGGFTQLTPARIADTRSGGTLPPLGTSKVQIRGAGGVPTTGVSAVVLNLTAVNPTTGGFLTAWPTGAGQPNASNVNFAAGQTVANLVIIPVGDDGTISVFDGSGGSVDIIADVAGYYRTGTVTTAGMLGALVPARILDTRGGGGVPGSSARALRVTGQGGVPASGVSAVVINITVTNPTGPGFVTAFPSGVNRPNASNLNFSTGQTVPNLVMVPVGGDGKVVLYNGSATPVDLITDVVGYVAG